MSNGAGDSKKVTQNYKHSVPTELRNDLKTLQNKQRISFDIASIALGLILPIASGSFRYPHDNPCRFEGRSVSSFNQGHNLAGHVCPSMTSQSGCQRRKLLSPIVNLPLPA